MPGSQHSRQTGRLRCGKQFANRVQQHRNIKRLLQQHIDTDFRGTSRLIWPGGDDYHGNRWREPRHDFERLPAIQLPIGGLLVAAVAIHVGALWITSPQDVIDVLLVQSPTPFSVWGLIGMWAIFAAALLAALRDRLRLRPRTWRISHAFLAVVIVVGSVVHTILIEGTMEAISKAALCGLVLAATTKVIADLRTRPKSSALR